MNKPQQPQQLNYSSILYNLTDKPITLTISGEQSIFKTNDISNSTYEVELLSENNSNFDVFNISQNLHFNNILINGTTTFELSGTFNGSSYNKNFTIQPGYYFMNAIANKLESELGFSKVKIVNQISFELTDLKNNDSLILSITQSHSQEYIGFENYYEKILNKSNNIIRLNRYYITKLYENGNSYTNLLENNYLDTRIPPIVQYESFIISNTETEKSLVFSTNNVFNVPSATIKDVNILFKTDTLKEENRDNRVRFSTIYFQGSITFVFSGIIVLNYSNNGTNVRRVLQVHLSIEIEPDYYFMHNLTEILNTKISDQLTEEYTTYSDNNETLTSNDLIQLENVFKISYQQNKFVFQNISSWNTSTHVNVSIFFYNTKDNDYFIFDAPNVTTFTNKHKVIVSDITSNDTYETNRKINYISVLPDLTDLSQQLNLLYNIYNSSAYELHYDYHVSLQSIIDQVIFTTKNPSIDLSNTENQANFIEAMKYYVLAGNYPASDYKKLNFDKFEVNNFDEIPAIVDVYNNYKNALHFTPKDFYNYAYKGIIIDGPPEAFDTPDLVLPRYTPNDLYRFIDVNDVNDVEPYSIAEIISGYDEDTRALYEDFAYPESNQNYGVFSCQDLHEIGNITIQDIIDHLGPNNPNLNSDHGLGKLNDYYKNRESSNGTSDGRVNNENMKAYIFTGFYSVEEISDSRYRNNSNNGNIEFVTADYYTYGYITQFRYYTPDVLRRHYTLQQIINDAGFSLQDLYDYNFKALELKNIRNSLTLQNIIDISFNKAEEAENRIDEMKYYIFSADYDVDVIKAATYVNLNGEDSTFTTNDFYKFAFIGDPNTEQRANMTSYGLHPVPPTIEFNQTYPSILVLPDSFPVENSNSRLLPPYYTPNELRGHYTFNEIINESGFSLQNLYNYYFTSDEFRLKNVTLQRQLNEIQFIKTNGSSDPTFIPEMKDYIFDGSYSITEIAEATYLDSDNSVKNFTPTDFSNFASAYVDSHYSPDKLRVSYSVAEIMDALQYFKNIGNGNGSYSFQNLYDHNFTALEFNIDGEVPLQEIVSNVDYDKNDNQNPVDEMKYYIFDGSYSIQDIFDASYNNGTLFTPADFSIYAQQHETGMYTPQALSGHFSIKHIIQGLDIYDGSYSIQRLYENNFTAFNFNTITNAADFNFDRNDSIRTKNDGIKLQYLIDNIIYNKSDGLPPTEEMKTYIFDASYSISDIISASYTIGDNTTQNKFTLNDFAVYSPVTMYPPHDLRDQEQFPESPDFVPAFTTLAIINEYKANNYTLQNLYDSDFTGQDLNLIGDIRLQTIFDQIQSFNKDQNDQNDIDEMKNYIFDASYSVSEIRQSTYPTPINSKPTVKDFSVYSFDNDSNNWKYNAQSLLNGGYTVSQVVTGPTIDTSYTLLHFYNMYTEFGNSNFSPRVIKENNVNPELSSLELQNAQTYYNVGYRVFDLHDAFKVFEVLDVSGIDISDVIQDTNGDSTPDSGYSIRELFYDSNGDITISGETPDNGLKYHYSIKAIINSIGFKPIMDVMNIVKNDRRGTISLPKIGSIQSQYNLEHKRNSENFFQGQDRGLMDLQLDAQLYAAIYFDKNGDIIDINENNASNVSDTNVLTYYFPALQLKEYYNYTYDQLVGPGRYLSAELLLTNRTAEEIYIAGVVLTPGIVVIFSFDDLRRAGYSEAAITAAQSKEITSKDLLGLGFDICDLNTFEEVNRTWSRFESPKPEQTTPEYLAELQMRRKAETLKYNNNAFVKTSKEQLKYIMKGVKTSCTRGITFASKKYGDSNANLANLPRVNNTLIFSQASEKVKSTPKPSYNSDVPGNKLLYLDKSIPLFGYKRQYTYSDN